MQGSKSSLNSLPKSSKCLFKISIINYLTDDLKNAERLGIVPKVKMAGKLSEQIFIPRLM